MNPFKAGDLVVCINNWDYLPLKVGKIYKVANSIGEHYVSLEEEGLSAILVSRFKKLDTIAAKVLYNEKI
jgi:hypothetical protein